MKIYTHYSDSHADLYENQFLPSLRKIYTKDELGLRVANHEQTTAAGEFMEQGWYDSMRYKLRVILQAVEENRGGYFIFSDVDVAFYDRFGAEMLGQLGDADIAAQEDCGTLCAGFFIARGNDRVKELFQKILDTFSPTCNDQVVLNELKHMVSWTLLDKKQFFSIGNVFDNEDGTHVWDNKSIITPPKEMLVHHANYVKGVGAKNDIIDMIKHGYESLVR